MIFLRHARTEAGSGVCYGRLDLALGAGAEGQMAAALERTPKVTAIRSSDLSRCRCLAERFAVRDGIRPVFDARLREYDFGAWEGRRWAEIPRAQSDPWAADPWATPPPGGETFSALHARVRAALDDCTDGTLVIAHAGVIRAARMILEGADLSQVFAESVPFCEPISFPRRAG